MRTAPNLPGTDTLSPWPTRRKPNRWNDDRWVASWPDRERLTEALSPYLLAAAAARPGQRVCDIGCGGGAPVGSRWPGRGAGGAGGRDRHFGTAARVGPGAGERGGRDNVEFVVMDVQTDALGQEPFDLAVSQLGVMFFDEPTAAFGAIRAPARPGGSLRLRLLAGGGAQPVAHGHGPAVARPAAAVPPPGKCPVAPSPWGTTSTSATSWVARASPTSRARPYDITVRAPASAVGDARCSSSWASRPSIWGRRTASLERHLERFAVGPGEYEYPLAFRVYEAVNG